MGTCARVLVLLGLLAVSIAISLSTLAQTPTATLTGRVTDPKGLAIVGAKVQAINIETNAVYSVETKEEGLYRILNIPPGRYRVVVEKEGFAQIVKPDVQLHIQDFAAINFSMQVGSVSQSITVEGGAPLINESGSTGGVMNNQQVTELPINGRDYARFSLLIPGAIARSNFISDLTFNGLHTVHNQYSIDGVDATRVDQPYMANGYERGARLLTGSLDTIAEFRVQTGNYEAQYGRSAGSSINIATKSGTNEIHGTLFEFFRNDVLDASNFFATKKPTFRFNDFGGNVGGPIRHDKTFYFSSYEGSRQRVGITGSGTVPSDLLRSQVLATSPALTNIVNLMPRGTSPTADPLVDNYTVTSVSRVREDTGSVRIDNSFGSRDTAFARVNVNDSQVAGPLFGVFPSAFGVLDHQNVPIRTTNIAIHEQHTFGSGLINDALVGMQRWTSVIEASEPFPQTVVNGLSIQPGTQGRYKQNATSIQFGNAISLIKGRHTLKSGVTVWRIRVNLAGGFGPELVQYNSINDFINNRLAFVSLRPEYPPNGGRATQIGAFIQDTFQWRHGLTLDYGLRYDFETVPHDYHDAPQTFDTRTQTLGPPGTPYFSANTANFGPRFAIAWSPKPRIVVRSGFGAFFQAYPVGFCCYSVPLNDVPGFLTLLRQQIPNLSYPFTPFLSQGTAPPPNVAGFAWEKPDIYVEQWNLSVATQITSNTAFQVAYVGNHGINLRRDININFFDPALGSRPNPSFGDISIETNSGFSLYHALQVSLKRRFSSGLLFDFEYTYGHVIDDVQDQGLFSAQPQDNNNIRAERGNGSGDIRHNFATNVMYDLPVGAGHRFLGSSHGVANRLASGWRLSALGILHTGIATTVYINTNTFGNGNFTNQRPDAVPNVDPYAHPRSVDQWLNPSAFAIPASGTFGNLGRNTVSGPSFKQIDFSIIKNTKIGEARNLEFRVEMFNVFNHPNFDEPNTFVGTSAFGKIFNTFGRTIGLGTSRQIQMGLKFNF